MINKLLPQNLDAEVSVLGSMLIDKIALHKSRNLLRKEDFYVEQNSVLFEAILQLDDNNVVPDIITLSEKLTGKIKPHIITGLISSTATSANIEHYAQIVKEKSVARALIRHQTETLEKAYNTEDIFSLLNNVKSGANDILQRGIIKEGWDLGKESIKVLEQIEADKGKISEFPLGLEALDNMIRLERGNVMIIGAESSFGKTSFALNIALNQNKKVLICSLEMTKEELIKRFISMLGQINSNRIRLNFLDANDWQSATSAIKILQNKNIILTDVSNLRQVQEAIIKYSPDMVVIDYLQLLQSQDTMGKSRAAIVGELSRQVKQITRENKIATILLSQLHRTTELKEPTLSRLKESGEIENSADIVLFLWWAWKANHDINRNEQKIIIAKNRNGETGFRDVSWKPEFFLYSDLKGDNNDKR